MLGENEKSTLTKHSRQTTTWHTTNSPTEYAKQLKAADAFHWLRNFSQTRPGEWQKNRTMESVVAPDREERDLGVGADQTPFKGREGVATGNEE